MPRPRLAVARAFAAVSLLVAALSVAHADNNTDAKKHYESGMAHYNLNELPEALAEFKEAYRLRTDPVFLFNIAQCHRRLDAPSEAATFYRSFLREKADTPNRAEVERLIAEMDAAAADKQAQAAEEERARQAPAQVAPTPAPLEQVAITAPPPARPTPLVRKAWFWGVVGGGVVVVAAAVVLGVVFGVQHDPKVSIGTAVVH